MSLASRLTGGLAGSLAGNLTGGGGAPAAPTPPLDAFSVAPHTAYSVWRRLLTTHTGNLVTVRKTTGGDVVSTLAVSYDAATNLLDTADLAAFVGSESWAFPTLHDQCAAARNAAQATGAAQPVGGVAGTAVLIGTHHAADFNGSSHFFTRGDSLGLSGAPALTIFIESTFDTGAVRYVFNLGTTPAAGNSLMLLPIDATHLQVATISGSRTFNVSSLTSGTHKFLIVLAAGAGIGTVALYQNGSACTESANVGPTTVLNLTTTNFKIGANHTGSATFLDGKMSEFVVWNAEHTGADLTLALAL